MSWDDPSANTFSLRFSNRNEIKIKKQTIFGNTKRQSEHQPTIVVVLCNFVFEKH